MPNASLDLVLLLIVIFGYLSNFLNWRYLNYGIIRLLYYIGAFVHESSHALLCVVTGAKIEEFTVFAEQPRVVHRKSKLPFLGEVLISFAPIAGGLLFLFLVNRYLLGGYFIIPPSLAGVTPQFSSWQNWQGILAQPLALLAQPLFLLAQINLLQWQSWVMILLFFNVGAMLGPSTQDLKNVWPALIVFFFVTSPWLVDVALVALGLIFINIILQVVVILLFQVVRWGR